MDDKSDLIKLCRTVIDGMPKIADQPGLSSTDIFSLGVATGIVSKLYWRLQDEENASTGTTP